MSRISGHSSRFARGFTLVEMMVSISILAIVLGGVLAAYTFLGRNLTRLVNLQKQQVQSRHLLSVVTRDISAASAVSTLTYANGIALILTKPTSTGTASVRYTYTNPSSSTAADGKIVRGVMIPPAVAYTDEQAPAAAILTSFTVLYYDSGGNQVSSSSSGIKSVEFSFTTSQGSTNGSSLTTLNTVSPRVVLRNKPALQ